MKKLLSLILIAVFCLSAHPLLGKLLAAVTVNQTKIFTSNATASETSSMLVTIQNGSTLGGSTTATEYSFPQYLRVAYNVNRNGYQAIVIFTDNSATAANPKYTGGGDGAGLVKTTSTTINAPLHWVVFPTAGAGFYTFAPIDPSNEFFVVDKKRPDGSAFPAGFASFIFDINFGRSFLAAAPIPQRDDTDGIVFIFLGANFAGASAGTYRTNQLKIQLVTLLNGNITAVHHEQVLTATVTKS